MKNKILKFVLIGALPLAVSVSFGQGIEKKSVRTNPDSVTTGLDIHQARIDSAADYRQFKAAAELKISENQKNIDLLRTKKSASTQETKEKYDKNLAMLQEKNTALKARIGASGQTATVRWPSFKREINNDLQELSRTIKTITADHTL